MENRLFERYRCDCGKTVGKHNKHSICSDCGSQVKRRDFIIVSEYKDGIAVAESKEGMFHVDMYGNALYPERYPIATQFSNDLALVVLNKRWFYIGKDFQPAFNSTYDSASDFENGYADVCNDDTWSLIDSAGRVLKSCTVGTPEHDDYIRYLEKLIGGNDCVCNV